MDERNNKPKEINAELYNERNHNERKKHNTYRNNEIAHTHKLKK